MRFAKVDIWEFGADDGCAAALLRPLNGMNATLMRRYVEYVGDFLMTELGFDVIYGAVNPVSTDQYRWIARL